MTWIEEKVLGTLDGSNRVFTTTYLPVPGSLMLSSNGLLLYGFRDYALDGQTITFINGEAPVAADLVVARYQVEDKR